MHESLRELVQVSCRHNADRMFLHLPEPGSSVTFAEFGQATESLAQFLSRVGLRNQERVAILLANGASAAVALLGVPAAGAVGVPLNPKLTDPEIEWLLHHSQSRFLLTDEFNAARWPQRTQLKLVLQVGEISLVLLQLSPGADGIPGDLSAVAPHSIDPAIILYTSGTTGNPKGVVLTHGNLLSNASGVREAHRLTPKDTALCVLPLFHINGLVITLITSLLVGASLVLPAKFSSRQFWHWVLTYRVRWFSAVPTILSLLLFEKTSPRPEISSLRFARSASAPLPVALLEEFENRIGVPVIESYGMSEAGGQVTSNPLPPLKHKPGSVGLPFTNEVQVVDEHGTPLRANQTGEVVLRGPNVIRGYLDNESANRESFRNGWFRTGDLGYFDADGYLFLVGRNKELINRAGEKIAPREIEEVIYRLPEIESAAVVGIPDPLYGEEVAVFVVLKAGQALTAEHLIAHCRRSLADFKTPKHVFFVAELIQGANGKVQRRKLLDVYADLIQSQTRSPIHEEMANSAHPDSGNRNPDIRTRASTAC